MPRPAGFFEFRGHYVTDAGGERTVLCPVEDGLKAAKDALQIHLGRLADEKQRGTPRRSKKTTVLDVCDLFLDEKKIECREATYRDYYNKLQPVMDRFGAKPITSLTKADGIAYKQWLMTGKRWSQGNKTGKGLSPTSVKDYLVAAKTMLSWAADEDQGFIPRNPWKKISTAQARSRKRIITDEEFAHLLAQCRSGPVKGAKHDLRHLLLLARATGLRRAEICQLRWEDIHERSGQIVIPAERVKTHHDRTVTITQAVARVLDERRLRLAELGATESLFVFPGYTQKKRRVTINPSIPMKPEHVTRRVWQLVQRCVRLGLIEEIKRGERISLHNLRHTRITELHASGLPLKTIMDESGHKKLPTNLNYTHPSEESRVDAVRRLAGGENGETSGS